MSDEWLSCLGLVLAILVQFKKGDLWHNQNAIEKQSTLAAALTLFATVYKNHLSANSWMGRDTFILTSKMKSLASQKVLKASFT